MYYRYGTTPRDRFFSDLRYFVRCDLRRFVRTVVKPALWFLAESIACFAWVGMILFVLPILAALLR